VVLRALEFLNPHGFKVSFQSLHEQEAEDVQEHAKDKKCWKQGFYAIAHRVEHVPQVAKKWEVGVYPENTDNTNQSNQLQGSQKRYINTKRCTYEVGCRHEVNKGRKNNEAIEQVPHSVRAEEEKLSICEDANRKLGKEHGSIGSIYVNPSVPLLDGVTSKPVNLDIQPYCSLESHVYKVRYDHHTTE
jgi:uncharacterized protein with PIN domain